MCTGRLDLAFVLRAFSKGADGVFIAGCRLNECNYVTHGNFYALSMTHLSRKLLEHAGIRPERLRMELLSGGEGNRFAETVNSFSETVRGLGRLGAAEGASEAELKERLDALVKLVPYIKVETREKLRSRLETAEEYETLFGADEVRKLLEEVPSYWIDPEKCQACRICAKRCPVDAIEGAKNRIHVIDQEKCIKCGGCFAACPPLFGAVAKIVGRPAPPPVPEEERTVARKKAART